MIEFQCDNCGAKFRVKEDRAGTQGKCPRCGEIVTIPTPLTMLLESEPVEAPPEEPVIISDEAFEPPPEPFHSDIPVTIRDESSGPQTKRLAPWILDIWLYPMNKAGLAMLGTLVGVPLVFKLFMSLISVWACFFIIPYVLAIALMFFYSFWYVAECVRDSADGEVRAPDTIARTPGISEILIQWFRLTLALLLCFLPLIWYGALVGLKDTAYWAIFAGCIFVMPMATLSVIMFDALAGLNPLVLIPSIISTFIPYCGLVILWGIIGVLITLIVMPVSGMPVLALYLFYTAVLYLSMVAAHLLGAFFNRYEERLNWEV